jgi:hypothetical protein
MSKEKKGARLPGCGNSVIGPREIAVLTSFVNHKQVGE